MGKDLNGKSLGTGISQRKDGRYEAPALINGVKVHLIIQVFLSFARTLRLKRLRLSGTRRITGLI